MNAPKPALLALALLAGCVSSTLDRPPVERASWEEAYPEWSGEKASWEKLGAIEEWLRGPGPGEWPEYVPEAELQLAEGRLDLAELERREIAPEVLETRVSAAEAGFRRALARTDLAPGQKARAELGLARAKEISGAVVPSAPAATGKLALEQRSDWRAAPPVARRLTRAAGPWSRITVHHSAKSTGELGKMSAGEVAGALRDIQTVHMRDRGYGDIGYHFLIDPTGRVWQGRLLEWQGAHSGGVNNVGNIGICLLGDYDHERPDPRGLRALEELIEALCERHGISRSKIFGHQQLRPTECPGDTLMAWVSRYAAGASH